MIEQRRLCRRWAGRRARRSRTSFSGRSAARRHRLEPAHADARDAAAARPRRSSTSRPSTSRCSPDRRHAAEARQQVAADGFEPWPSTVTFSQVGHLLDVHAAAEQELARCPRRRCARPRRRTRRESRRRSPRADPRPSPGPPCRRISSTTIALCSRLRWNSFSRSGTRLVSGTKCAGRISGVIEPASACLGQLRSGP